MQSSQSVEEVVKEFEPILDFLLSPNLDVAATDMDSRSGRERAREFLRYALTSAIASERERIVGILEGMIVKDAKYDPDEYWDHARNSALSDSITVIKNNQ